MKTYKIDFTQSGLPVTGGTYDLIEADWVKVSKWGIAIFWQRDDEHPMGKKVVATYPPDSYKSIKLNGEDQ